MTNSMTASRLRTILIAVILVMIIGTAGGFWFAQKKLSSYATDISKLNADAQSGGTSIQSLKDMEAKLQESDQIIADAKALIADSDTYADKAVGDITRIAKESGVTIKSIELSDLDTTGASSAGTVGAAAPTTAASPAVTPGTAGATTSAPQTIPGAPGVTKKTISVTIDSPVKYDNLLKFVNLLEHNKLKLQLASLSMTKDEGDMVTTSGLSIGVFVR